MTDACVCVSTGCRVGDFCSYQGRRMPIQLQRNVAVSLNSMLSSR
jgi:hypothetical protein